MSNIKERLRGILPSKLIEKHVKRFQKAENEREAFPVAAVQHGLVLVQLGLGPETAADIVITKCQERPSRKKARTFIKQVEKAIEPAFNSVAEGDITNGDLVLLRYSHSPPSPENSILALAMNRLTFFKKILINGIEPAIVKQAFDPLRSVLGNPFVDWKGAQEIFKRSPELFGYPNANSEDRTSGT